MPSHESDHARTSGLRRRAVLKGAAWSVPVVVALGATPAYAVSDAPPAPVSFTVNNTGGTFTYVWTVKNPNPGATMTVNIASVPVTYYQGANPTTIAAGTDATFQFQATQAGNTPPGFTMTISWSVAGATGSTLYTVLGNGKVNNGTTETWQLSGTTYSDPTP